MIDELRAKCLAGEVHALAILVELTGRPVPLCVRTGRYETEPFRCLAAGERMRHDIQVAIYDQDLAASGRHHG